MPRYHSCGHNHPSVFAISRSGADKHNEKLIKAMLDSGDGIIAVQENFEYNARQLAKALNAGFEDRLNDVDFDALDFTIKANMEMNLFRFSSAKSLGTLMELQDLYNKSANDGEFKQRAKQLLGKVNYTYLDTETQRASSTATNAARYQKQLEEADILPYLEYQTVGDDRVRSAHEKLDGMIFRIDDPAIKKIYAPNGHKCRCEMVARRDIPKGRSLSTEEDALNVLNTEVDKNGVSEWQKMVKGGFHRNLGDAMEIWDNNQFYVDEWFDGSLTVEYNGVDLFDDLEDLEPLPKNLSWTVETAKDWFLSKYGLNGLKSKKKIRLLDVSKRPLIMHKKDFEDNLTAKTAKLVPQLETAIDSPDEIYMLSEKNGAAYQLRYFKFYEGSAMVADVTITKKQMTIPSWEKIPKSKIDKARTGILIYQK